VRFELTYMALAPDLKIEAPWREWNIRSREDAIDYAEAKKIPITASRTKIYSRDRNLWHISHEGGALESPANMPPEDVWMLTVSPEEAPDQPRIVTIGYEKGAPVSVDGRRMAPEALVAHLNEIGGRHGVGRVDITENRLVGMKSRGVYETPGGTIILEGLKTLRSLTMDRDTARMCEKLMPEYADLVYTGRWFAPLREAMDVFFAKACETVSGSVQVKLYKGSATAVAATSPYSLYSEDLATFGHSASFSHADSKGFVKLYGLPGMVAATVRRGAEKKAAKPSAKKPAKVVAKALVAGKSRS
jgi:argininosuccinate synthase